MHVDSFSDDVHAWDGIVHLQRRGIEKEGCKQKDVGYQFLVGN
jgi:hypothetical protein